ncbi:DUF1800 domain-containing protein [Flavobacterium sp. IMCC34852]|uniref:DUF1800 domain-containing protein n=1 Tax=Flavobacterium rivulicola TaxID=2732161 RepID=A0A7Y3VZQ4_9FLAO|nr:DUF1800 domain-containing protein [Flavobacterium sp. IMCC34852]NNT72736.1 DUF1800 domain-containing protein [Flavobacterium sp. IMCC34852]
MNKHTLWSLRLGFSGKQSKLIENMGLPKFLEQSYVSSFDKSVPSFLDKSPKSIQELKAKRQELKNISPEEAKELLKIELQVSQEMKAWWLEKMIHDEYPLREKMSCFWHNHFVSTYQKVKVNHWIFQHNQLLRENAFGNFKTLTKQVIQTNAMVRYLDNVDNRRDKINENLSRELLELFTLGIGHYTEDDIKNGAKGLAGLNLGEDQAVYRRMLENNDTITYFGKTGKFKVGEMVDIIFEQKAVPYLLTRKILKWFIYDNPSEELVQYYGDYFRKADFEIKPLLTKIFTEEFAKDNAGSKIKDPLVYIIQLMHELNVAQLNPKLVVLFLRQQGMDLFNQPNVKGWNGGKEWLTSQIYLQRNNAADLLCNGKSLSRRKQFTDDEMMNESRSQLVKVKLHWDKTGNNKTIIAELTNRLLFQVDDNLQKEFEAILKYDFNPKAQNADDAVLRLFNAMVKTPEYQLI